jgi:hypothetical protein
MATERKGHDIVLPEVRKPAAYGRLVAVISTGDSSRELWFQHDEEPDIVRTIRIDVDTSTMKPITLKTSGKRERTGFKL